MFKEKWEKAKNLMVAEEGKTNKKKIENLIVLLIILIVTILAMNAIWNGDTKKQKSNKEETQNLQLDGGKQLAQNIEESEKQTNNVDLKANLEDILSQMEGVGKVSVLVTYSESSKTVAMYNENTQETSTEEKDTSGGTRLIKESNTQKDVIFEENNGEKKPIVQKTVMPKIEGAIITAEGANNANIKTNIVQAVEAVTGLATHKIQVFEMSK